MSEIKRSFNDEFPGDQFCRSHTPACRADAVPVRCMRWSRCRFEFESFGPTVFKSKLATNWVSSNQWILWFQSHHGSLQPRSIGLVSLGTKDGVSQAGGYHVLLHPPWLRSGNVKLAFFRHRFPSIALVDLARFRSWSNASTYHLKSLDIMHTCNCSMV